VPLHLAQANKLLGDVSRNPRKFREPNNVSDDSATAIGDVGESYKSGAGVKLP